MKRAFGLAACAGLVVAAYTGRSDPPTLTALILLTDGRHLEAPLQTTALEVEAGGGTRRIRTSELLSVHRGSPPSAHESERIASDLAAVQSADRPARDAAIEGLVEIGLPALSPLLAAYKDTDAREPAPLYRLFARIIPGAADIPDRNADLIRLASGETQRGRITTLQVDAGDSYPVAGIRRIAIRRGSIDRALDVQALRHCTQVEFLDTGIAVTADSRITVRAVGFARLAFGEDGWASGPDGLQTPGPNYHTNLVDGFPFGALVGRVSARGPRWLAGSRFDGRRAEAGRLYLGVNDNPHWQNNLRSYRVKLRVTSGYDLGEPQ